MPGALALLDQRIALGGSMRNAFREAKAGLLGEYGDVTAALLLFDSLIADKPGSPSLMNARCWAKGTRMVMIDSALKDCTGAIELSTGQGTWEGGTGKFAGVSGEFTFSLVSYGLQPQGSGQGTGRLEETWVPAN